MHVFLRLKTISTFFIGYTDIVIIEHTSNKIPELSNIVNIAEILPLLYLKYYNEKKNIVFTKYLHNAIIQTVLITQLFLKFYPRYTNKNNSTLQLFFF